MTCFFEECESQFRFLEEKHGYLYLSGLAEYQSHYKIITPYKNVRSGPETPFFAVTRYERDNQAIELFYGDKNYALDVYIYPDSIRRFSLQDIIAAARKNPSEYNHMSYLTEKDMIAQSLEWFSTSMRKHPQILSPGEKLMKRAEVMRERILEQSVRAHLETLIRTASERAAEAFVAKDYGLVVEILSLYQDHLSRSDLKKLRIAREKLS